jgi:rhodanese-related sulfurtransferase
MINMNASEFVEKISDPDVILLDVSTVSEFSQSHVPSAINLDVLEDDFISLVSELDKSKSYAIYCRSGKRSVDACEVMSEIGFKSIYNLSGGIIEWVEAGKAITS